MLLLGVKNTNSQTLAPDSMVNLGSVYRQYSKKNKCGIKTFDFNGTGITLQHEGVYKSTITATFTGAAAGDVIFQLYENGNEISGAVVTETITTAGTETKSVSLDYYTLVNSSCVLGNYVTSPKTLTLVSSGIEATVTNIVVDVLKVV